MYNDYYLEQINNKLNSLEELIENQETIITNQEILISGDNGINNKIEQMTPAIYTIAIVMTLYVIFYYVVRCLK